MLGEFTMRNSANLKNICSRIIKALRLRIFNFDLQYNWEVGSTYEVAHSTSTVVPRLSITSCMGKKNEVLDKHREQSKIQLNDSGININSRETVCILVDSFAEKLGNWAAQNDPLINSVNCVRTLGLLLDVSYGCKENLAASEYFHPHYLIKLD
jgi:hypothetical protein